MHQLNHVTLQYVVPPSGCVRVNALMQMAYYISYYSIGTKVLCTSKWYLLVCVWEDQRKNWFYIFHKISSVLYGKYNAMVSKYSTVILILVCNQCNKQPPLIIIMRLCGFLTLLKWIHKDNSKEVCPAWYKGHYLESLLL